MDILNDDSSSHISLFEMKRVKGWWPCIDVAGGDPELTVISVSIRSYQLH